MPQLYIKGGLKIFVLILSLRAKKDWGVSIRSDDASYTKQLFLRNNAQSPEAAAWLVRALPASCARCDAGSKADADVWQVSSGMLHRELAMSEERTTYLQAERQAAMMNQITVFRSSPSDFLHTQEQSTAESIDTYKEFKQLLEEYSDEQFVPSIVEQFCKMVYKDEEHYIFFKPFCNLYFSVNADALL